LNYAVKCGNAAGFDYFNAVIFVLGQIERNDVHHRINYSESKRNVTKAKKTFQILM